MRQYVYSVLLVSALSVSFTAFEGQGSEGDFSEIDGAGGGGGRWTSLHRSRLHPNLLRRQRMLLAIDRPGGAIVDL